MQIYSMLWERNMEVVYTHVERRGTHSLAARVEIDYEIYHEPARLGTLPLCYKIEGSINTDILPRLIKASSY